MMNKNEEYSEEELEAELLKAMSNFDEELPVYKAHSGELLKQGIQIATHEAIIDALKSIYDPEIPINIYDLGLIYDIKRNPIGDIAIDMSLTAPNCPVAGILPQQIADVLADVDGVGRVVVEVVWEPAWTIDRLSEDAKMILEMS